MRLTSNVAAILALASGVAATLIHLDSSATDEDIQALSRRDGTWCRSGLVTRVAQELWETVIVEQARTAVLC
ncbi:hypothetical protein VE04_05013 [Pseudogymnoascus sp. 24MN13]|nr:hypothetical protein VE04_05013 [Pseudogymnoascus sp. 24MN13]